MRSRLFPLLLGLLRSQRRGLQLDLERLQLPRPVREPGRVHLQRLSLGDAELDSELAQRISEWLGVLHEVQ